MSEEKEYNLSRFSVMSKQRPEIRHILVLLPSLAVLTGLYFFKNAFLAIGLYHLGMAVILFAPQNRGLFKRAFKGWNTLEGILMTLAASSAGLFCYLLGRWVFKTDLDFSALLSGFGLNRINWLFFCLYFCTVNPFLEEVFWRAYFMERRGDGADENRNAAMDRGFHILTLPDAGFAVYHLLVLYFFVKPIFLVPVFIGLVVGAVLWRFLYRRHGGLVICIISHIAADAGIVLVATLMMG